MISKSEKTRQHIIEQSAVLFNRKGFSGTSMHDILGATGLQKGGIYGHFASKEEIALAAFDFAFDKVMTSLGEKVKAHRHAKDRLLAIVNFYRNYSINPTISGGCPIQNASIESDDAFPALKVRTKAAVEYMINSIKHILEKGIERGEIRPEVNSELEALSFYSTIQGALLLAQVTDNPDSLNAVLDILKNHIKTRLTAH